MEVAKSTACNAEAEQLGYSVIVAEGTSSVLMKILEGEADAILGVACLDSLEKSFHRVAELGVPHLALPLLKNGCVDTEGRGGADPPAAGRRHARCRREATAAPQLHSPAARDRADVPTAAVLPNCSAHTTSRPAGRSTTGLRLDGVPRRLDWLQEGGKRLRPFVTLAAYAVARHGAAVLDCGDRTGEMIPPPVRRLALAIEALHKASLVHDDIEDDDEFRYGRPTLHRVHGVGQAINIGDYLIGLGYRLIAGETGFLGGGLRRPIFSTGFRTPIWNCAADKAPTLVAEPAAGTAAAPGRAHRLRHEDLAGLRGGHSMPACGPPE